MAKKAITTKENPVEEKSIDMTPEMEELKKQVDGLKLENEELTKATKEWKEKIRGITCRGTGVHS